MRCITRAVPRRANLFRSTASLCVVRAAPVRPISTKRAESIPRLMAEGAIDARLFLPVAFHAAAHRDIALSRQSLAVGDRAVALLALIAFLQMRAVAEVHPR